MLIENLAITDAFYMYNIYDVYVKKRRIVNAHTSVPGVKARYTPSERTTNARKKNCFVSEKESQHSFFALLAKKSHNTASQSLKELFLP